MNKKSDEKYYLLYFDDKMNEEFLGFNCIEKVKAYLEQIVIEEEVIYHPCVFKGKRVDFDCDKFMTDFYEEHVKNED